MTLPSHLSSYAAIACVAWSTSPPVSSRPDHNAGSIGLWDKTMPLADVHSISGWSLKETKPAIFDIPPPKLTLPTSRFSNPRRQNGFEGEPAWAVEKLLDAKMELKSDQARPRLCDQATPMWPHLWQIFKTHWCLQLTGLQLGRCPVDDLYGARLRHARRCATAAARPSCRPVMLLL